MQNELIGVRTCVNCGQKKNHQTADAVLNLWITLEILKEDSQLEKKKPEEFETETVIWTRIWTNVRKIED